MGQLKGVKEGRSTLRSRRSTLGGRRPFGASPSGLAESSSQHLQTVSGVRSRSPRLVKPFTRLNRSMVTIASMQSTAGHAVRSIVTIASTRSPANLAVRPVESGLLSTVKSAALTRAIKEPMGLINRVNTVSILINGD